MNQEKDQTSVDNPDPDPSESTNSLHQKLLSQDPNPDPPAVSLPGEKILPTINVSSPKSPPKNFKETPGSAGERGSQLSQTPKSSPPVKMRGYLIFILILNILVCVGMAYTYDFPQALEDPLIEMFGIDTLQVEYLYALYALPNLLMAPVSGYLIEKLNAPLSGLFMAFLTTLGHGLCLLAVYSGKFGWALAGRSIFGIGGEGLFILQATINEYWFSGVLLSVSNTLCQVAISLADLTGNFITPLTYDISKSLNLPLFIGTCVCGFSCIVVAVYYWAHKKYDTHTKEEAELSNMHPNKKELEKYFALVELDPDFTLEFGFRSIRFFNLTFWLLCLVYLFLQNAIVQFSNMATEVVMNRYRYRYEEAKYFTTLPQLSIIVFSPAVAWIITRRGKKALALLLASLLCCLNYVSMYFAGTNKPRLLYFNMVVIGLSYSVLLASIYSSIALTVPKSGVSMAYSILALVDNLGVAFMPLYFGWLSRDRTVQAYNFCILNMIGLAAVAVLLSVCLLIHDVKEHGLLELPENSKQVAKLRKKIDSEYMRRSFERASQKISRRSSGNNSKAGSREVSRNTSPKNSNRNILFPQVENQMGSALSSEPYETLLLQDNKGETTN